MKSNNNWGFGPYSVKYIVVFIIIKMRENTKEKITKT